MSRAPLVLMPNGSLVRTTDVPPDGIIVVEPPQAEAPAQSVIDQTAAVTRHEEPPASPKARFDI